MVEESAFARIVARRVARINIPAEAVTAVFGETEKRLDTLGSLESGISEIRIYLQAAHSLKRPNVEVGERELGQIQYHLDRLKPIGIDISGIIEAEGSRAPKTRYITIKPDRLTEKNFGHFAEELRKRLAEK